MKSINQLVSDNTNEVLGGIVTNNNITITLSKEELKEIVDSLQFTIDTIGGDPLVENVYNIINKLKEALK